MSTSATDYWYSFNYFLTTAELYSTEEYDMSDLYLLVESTLLFFFFWFCSAHKICWHEKNIRQLPAKSCNSEFLASAGDTNWGGCVYAPVLLSYLCICACYFIYSRVSGNLPQSTSGLIEIMFTQDFVRAKHNSRWFHWLVPPLWLKVC